MAHPIENQTKDILIEIDIDSNYKTGDVIVSYFETKKFYRGRKAFFRPIEVPKEHASVLIRPHEALKCLVEGRQVQEWNQAKMAWEDIEPERLVIDGFRYRLKPDQMDAKNEAQINMEKTTKQLKRVLIEVAPAHLPMLKVGDIREVVSENDEQFCLKFESYFVWTLKTDCTVLIEPCEALKALDEGNVQMWDSIGNDWVDLDKKSFVSNFRSYRLKPEPPKPKYEPFTMEDWQEFTKMPVREKSEQYFWFITEFDNERITDNASFTYTYTEALEALQFINGQPFGKQVK